MRKKVFLLLITTLLLAAEFAVGQLYTASNAYNSLHLKEAIKKYKKVIKKDETNGEALFNIANCYRLSGEFSEAEKWFERAAAYYDDSRAKLFYAQMLMANEKYEVAATWYDKYSRATTNANNSRNAKRLSQQCHELLETGIQGTPLVLDKVSFNSPGIDFSPAYYQENYIVFASNRAKGERDPKLPDPWNEGEFVDLFMVEVEAPLKYSEVMKFSSVINSKYHEGPVSFSAEGDIIYFTRTDFKGTRLRTDNQLNSRLNIYKAIKTGSSWGKVERLDFNSKESNSAHPALSPDQEYLIFASDRPGGYGGMDLYISWSTGSGWGDPVNMGLEINTSGSEAFPFIDENGDLYYSSDFLVGVGGLDVFKAEKTGRKWKNPQNMGAPINSPKDDFGFIFDPNHKGGFFTSNREGLLDDIYHFHEKPVIDLVGVVRDCRDSSEVPNALIEIDEDGLLARKLHTNVAGEFINWLDFDRDYHIVVEKEGYEVSKECPGYVEFNTDGMEYANQKVEVEIWLNRIVPPVEIVEMISGRNVTLEAGARITLHNIYFNLAKADIRTDAVGACMELLSLLKRYPHIEGELSAHTDSRGSDPYNLKLSQDRATSVYNFLIHNGVEESRLTAVGYGETQLKNSCTNGVQCSEAEHQMNRRVEFLITSMGDEEVEIIKIE